MSVASSVTAPISVEVADRGTIGTGERLTLDPGSYALRVAAEGYVGTEITREVLPGVTSVLAFDLEPVLAPEAEPAPGVLPDAVESSALANLARFSVTRFRSDLTCGTGVLVGADGLLLTTYVAIRGADDIFVLVLPPK